VYLPAGQWYDWWTGEKYQGGKSIDRPVDLATLPLFVRAGAIIPLDPVRQYTSQPVNEPTTLQIFGGADGDFTLYDDDGHTPAYQSKDDPQAKWLRLHWNDAAGTLTISPDPRMKTWTFGTRAFNLQFGRDEAAVKPAEFSGMPMTIPLH
jgi:alpha-glucosidase (family GH31 glycosyl hydrolase)